MRPAQPGQLEEGAHLVLARALEDRSLGLEAQDLGSPPEVGLQDLPDVHGGMAHPADSGRSQPGFRRGGTACPPQARCGRRCPCSRGVRPSCRPRRSFSSRRYTPSPAVPRLAAARRVGRPLSMDSSVFSFTRSIRRCASSGNAANPLVRILVGDLEGREIDLREADLTQDLLGDLRALVPTPAPPYPA